MTRLFVGTLVAYSAAAAQTAITPISSIPGVAEYGLPMGLAAWVFWCWRQDKKDDAIRYERLAEESARRYEKLATDYRQIVAENTSAITSLVDTLQARPCLIKENK